MHGDFIRVNPETKGIYILGRSDGVLNPSGVRFGSSEIYTILSTPRFSTLVTDSIVVGQQRLTPPYSDSSEQVFLFIKTVPSVSTGTLRVCHDLEVAVREQIAHDLSRRHIPAFISVTESVPYNANGKKLEIQLKAVLSGGGPALARLKVTQEEREQLQWYLQFYEIEKVVEGIKAKLQMAHHWSRDAFTNFYIWETATCDLTNGSLIRGGCEELKWMDILHCPYDHLETRRNQRDSHGGPEIRRSCAPQLRVCFLHQAVHIERKRSPES
ncbi:uncharacterized protein A1O5_08557 [Cladophialophora psammophila CBS 110553]|uniref:AMP-dependent synthetase/ligase domain-containing protein n=1 Tax=Cladophialophora psammophila CBS 110553 TaxID=1182543 RepID=W9WJ61_9EURO|nr:uncharacterized protein A1O5_08557 [Cladophialophora psammophila CBS 110553]EXJ67943.1 hypothetical protein A1O5_08557 [Cladophialophora psammophila CBS 110553]